MNEKKQSRLRRAKSTRLHIRALRDSFVCKPHSASHLCSSYFSRWWQSFSTSFNFDASLRSGTTGNVDAATKVGALIAERAKAAGVTKVAFDRSGFKYHGRIKALADAARENGLEF